MRIEIWAVRWNPVLGNTISTHVEERFFTDRILAEKCLELVRKSPKHRLHPTRGLDYMYFDISTSKRDFEL
jgi:hypothetical protein